MAKGILRWEDDPGFPKQAQQDRKGPYKGEAGDQSQRAYHNRNRGWADKNKGT